MWLLCRKYGDGMSGRTSLPFSGTILEQDAELMLAFQIFEETQSAWNETLKKRQEQRTKLEEEAQSLFQNPSLQIPS